MSCCGNKSQGTPSFHPSQVNRFKVDTPDQQVGQQILNVNGSEPNNDKIIRVSDKPIPARPIINLVKTATAQENKLSWFLDGVTGLKKCITNDIDYSKEQIESNRQSCKNCEYSTKKDGKITTFSQCMAPDPAKNNQPCGCFILCKTQAGKCPLGKWTDLTINKT